MFVNKQLFWWSASITLDNNNDVLSDFNNCSHSILYHIPQMSLLVVFLGGFSVWNIFTHMTTMLCVVSLKFKIKCHENLFCVNIPEKNRQYSKL